jgi:RNA polymerase subunit RPABC4/transcription elongation factor Spt4
MIFIAGVSPKKKVLDQNPRRCPMCGSSQAYSQRIDHYLSLFFIPVFRVKKGEPFVVCDRCAQTAGGFGPDPSRQQTDASGTCRSCGKVIDPEFNYCPRCGKRL